MADQFNILDSAPEAGDMLTAGEATSDRGMVSSASISMSTQSLRLAYFTARRTESIGNVRIYASGTAAGATPTLVRVGIWTAAADGALLSLVGSTANDTTLLATINTAYTKALSSSFTKQRGQRYAFGLLVVTGAAAPTTIGYGFAGLATEMARSPRLCALVNGQADLPATVAAGSLSDSTVRIFGMLLP